MVDQLVSEPCTLMTPSACGPALAVSDTVALSVVSVKVDESASVVPDARMLAMMVPCANAYAKRPPKRPLHAVAWGQAGGLATGPEVGKPSTGMTHSTAADALLAGVIVMRT